MGIWRRFDDTLLDDGFRRMINGNLAAARWLYWKMSLEG